MSEIKLSEEQERAVELCCTHPISILTGSPGTGKSTTTRAIVDRLRGEDGSKLVLAMAPTGRAAKRLSECIGHEAKTIHRSLGWRRDHFVHDRTNPLWCDAVVGDECSMIDAYLMATLLDAIPQTARVVLVGDADQLPSVGPGTVFRDIILSKEVPVARLTKLFRQDERSRIAENCARINRGDMPVFVDAIDTAMVEVDDEELGDELERVLLELAPAAGFEPREVQILVPQNKGPIGVDALNDRLQKLLNPDSGQQKWKMGATELRLRDRVVQTKNDYDLVATNGAEGVFNGEMGTITGFHMDDDGKTERMALDLGDRTVLYPRESAVGLKLAYAISVHRGQGSEFPAVIVVCSSPHTYMLSRQLFYTAMSRPKRYCWVVGDAKAVGRAVRNTTPHKRRTGLVEQIHAAVGRLS